MSYLWLAIAILFEVLGTLLIINTKEFTKLIPSCLVIISYCISFYMMSLAMKTIPLGISYAIWSGVGIVSLAIIGYFIHKQKLDTPAFIGIGLIIVGVLVIRLFSKSTL